mmetsp:Transcript_19288/g.34854  ORF Transcript_19288/g.34854 Transcript_19288/m.34854 type:complete len:330 (-) Transcript_19288:81-1070(-)
MVLKSSGHARINRCRSSFSLLLSQKLCLKGSSLCSSSRGLSSLLCLKDALWTGLLLWLKNGNNIIQRNLGSHNSLRIVGKHDRNPDTNHTLPQGNMTHSHIGVNLGSMTRLDHVSIAEFHGLGTLSSKLSRNDHLATLSGSLHDETHDTVASTTDGKSSQQLELERLSLGLRTKSLVLHTLSIQLNGTIGKIKPLLHHTGQLTNALSLLSEHVLRLGCADDDFGTMGGGTDLDTSVTILGKFAGEELVEFGEENTVGNKLALGRHFGAVGHHLRNVCCLLKKYAEMWIGAKGAKMTKMRFTIVGGGRRIKMSIKRQLERLLQKWCKSQH